MDELGNPMPPFLWFGPDPDEEPRNPLDIPVWVLGQEAAGISGIVAAPRSCALDMIEDWLDPRGRGSAPNARLVIAVYPTCGTEETDIDRLREIARRFASTAQIRLQVFRRVTDRPMTVLCFVSRDSQEVAMALGPLSDLGLSPDQDDLIGVAFRPDARVAWTYGNYFDGVWAQSRDVLEAEPAALPSLCLPPGTAEAAERWATFQEAWSPRSAETTGASPSVATGLVIDELSSWVQEIYGLGDMVTIDKSSRVRPLDAPLDPAWFGDVAATQRGTVTRKVSLRASVFDEDTLKTIEKYRQALPDLLKWFSFGLADGTRWMPRSARRLFESEVKKVSEAGKSLIGKLLKGDVREFLEDRKSKLAADLRAMFRDRNAEMPSFVLEQVLNRLQERLTKGQSANFLPVISYSSVGFSSYTNEWTNPWGQAWALLSDMVAFPRRVMTDHFFVRGLTIPESDLLPAMDVLDEGLAFEAATAARRETWQEEVRLIAEVEKSPLSPRERCELIHDFLASTDRGTLWARVKGGAR